MGKMIDFWKEQLQEIVVETKEGRLLRLHIDQNDHGYCLVGELHEIAGTGVYSVGFSKNRTPDASDLLKVCLSQFNNAMEQKGDLIMNIRNTCNTPIVSKNDQETIISQLEISAEVIVNT